MRAEAVGAEVDVQGLSQAAERVDEIAEPIHRVGAELVAASGPVLQAIEAEGTGEERKGPRRQRDVAQPDFSQVEQQHQNADAHDRQDPLRVREDGRTGQRAAARHRPGEARRGSRRTTRAPTGQREASSIRPCADIVTNMKSLAMRPSAASSPRRLA